MKINFIIGFLFMAFPATCVHGQNLVPNPDFEIYSQCPDNQAELNYATGWFSPTGNTPDYFNACYTGINLFHPSVPVNYPGFQYAYSGNGYAGFGALYQCNNNCREYVSAQLTSPLQAGKKYCVEFWISIADSSLTGVTPIGAYFSDTLVNDPTTIEYLPFQPQVQSDPNIPIDDTINWTLVKGSFTAQGGEDYIIIGTFLPNTQLNYDTIRTTSQPIPYFTYCYVDDISVIEIADCNAGNDAAICFNDSLQLGTTPDSNVVYSWSPSIGLDNSNIANPKASPFSTTTYTLTQTQCNVISTSSVTVTVNHDCNSAADIFIPTILRGNDELIITGLEANSMLEIFDMRGRLVFKSSDYENDFGAFEVSEGNYVVRLTRPNGEVVKQKLCVVR